MLIVIKGYKIGFQIVEIAQKRIHVHDNVHADSDAIYLFSHSSFLDNDKIGIWHGLVWYMLEPGWSLGNNTTVERIFAHPVLKGSNTEKRTPPQMG